MRKRLILNGLVVPALLFTSVACSVSKAPQTPVLPKLFTLTGQWVVVNDSKLMDQVMFDFRNVKGADFDLKVWGKKAKLSGIRKMNDQVIFSYDAGDDEPYNVLVQVLEHDRIKLSTIMDPIYEFQPVGKLGEKVYHLEKRNPGDLKLITKIVKDED